MTGGGEGGWRPGSPRRRGAPRWRAGERWRSDEPERVGGALDAVAAGLGLGSARGVGALHARWADIVGEAAAAHATPGTLRGGRLTVEVDHPAWATSLAHLEQTLIARIADIAGPGVVDAIRIQVRPSGGG